MSETNETHLSNGEESVPNEEYAGSDPESTDRPEIGSSHIHIIPLPPQAQSIQLVDALLKSHQSVYQHIRTDALRDNALKLSLIAVACLFVYGVIIGAFSGEIQWLAAPIKVVLGTALTALLCYPSLYILSALSGTDLRPAQIAMLLISSLALTGLLLVGFAPVAFVFTFSIQALPFMGFIHLLVGLTSLYFGMRYMAHGVVSLGAKDTTMIKVWAAIFLLTLLQMSTTLRPILGSADYLFTTEKQFFLLHWFNAVNPQ